MSLYVFLIGESEFEKPEEYIRKLARNSLIAVKPTKIITDYSDGWNKIVLDEAAKIGVPYMGVLPYRNETPTFKKMFTRASSNIVFSESPQKFLLNPYPYYDWLQKHVNEILAYLDTQKPGIKRNIIKVLKDKKIRNLYSGG